MVGLQQQYGIYWIATYLMAVTSTALGALVGSSGSDPTVAIEFLPAVFMPQILFAGFFIPFEIMPVWLGWLTYIFPLTYAVRLVLVQEFNGACDGTDGGFCGRIADASGGELDPSFCETMFSNLNVNPEDLDIPNNCEMLLGNVDANSEDTWWYWIVLFAQFVFFRVLALVVLRRKAEQFY
jgi:ABC-type multidrug transport system permease subunit